MFRDGAKMSQVVFTYLERLLAGIGCSWESAMLRGSFAAFVCTEELTPPYPRLDALVSVYSKF